MFIVHIPFIFFSQFLPCFFDQFFPNPRPFSSINSFGAASYSILSLFLKFLKFLPIHVKVSTEFLLIVSSVSNFQDSFIFYSINSFPLSLYSIPSFWTFHLELHEAFYIYYSSGLYLNREYYHHQNKFLDLFLFISLVPELLIIFFFKIGQTFD